MKQFIQIENENGSDKVWIRSDDVIRVQLDKDSVRLILHYRILFRDRYEIGVAKLTGELMTKALEGLEL